VFPFTPNTGMKVYTTEEAELIMEPSLKWAANPNITVVVKAYGLKATAQVHNNAETCILFIFEASS
jgi:hypothetical protein